MVVVVSVNVARIVFLLFGGHFISVSCYYPFASLFAFFHFWQTISLFQSFNLVPFLSAHLLNAPFQYCSVRRVIEFCLLSFFVHSLNIDLYRLELQCIKGWYWRGSLFICKLLNRSGHMSRYWYYIATITVFLFYIYYKYSINKKMIFKYFSLQFHPAAHRLPSVSLLGSCRLSRLRCGRLSAGHLHPLCHTHRTHSDAPLCGVLRRRGHCQSVCCCRGRSGLRLLWCRYSLSRTCLRTHLTRLGQCSPPALPPGEDRAAHAPQPPAPTADTLRQQRRSPFRTSATTAPATPAGNGGSTERRGRCRAHFSFCKLLSSLGSGGQCGSCRLLPKRSHFKWLPHRRHCAIHDRRLLDWRSHLNLKWLCVSERHTRFKWVHSYSTYTHNLYHYHHHLLNQHPFIPSSTLLVKQILFCWPSILFGQLRKWKTAMNL